MTTTFSANCQVNTISIHMGVAEVKRLRELEVENGRLKRIVAERDLEIDALREVLKKNW